MDKPGFMWQFKNVVLCSTLQISRMTENFATELTDSLALLFQYFALKLTRNVLQFVSFNLVLKSGFSTQFLNFLKELWKWISNFQKCGTYKNTFMINLWFHDINSTVSFTGVFVTRYFLASESVNWFVFLGPPKNNTKVHSSQAKNT